YPVVSGVHSAKQAEDNAAAYEKVRGLSGSVGIPGVVAAVTQEKHIREKIIAPLEEAARVDPGNARWPTQLAYWYAKVNAMKRPSVGPCGEEADEVRKVRLYLGDAQRNDPQGRQGYWAEYQIRTGIARRLETRGAGPLLGPLGERIFADRREAALEQYHFA